MSKTKKRDKKKELEDIKKASAIATEAGAFASISLFPEGATIITGIAQLFKILADLGISKYYDSYEVNLKKLVKKSLANSHISDMDREWCEQQAIVVLNELEIDVNLLIRDKLYINKLVDSFSKDLKGEEKEIFSKVLFKAINYLKNDLNTEETINQIIMLVQDNSDRIEKLERKEIQYICESQFGGPLSYNPSPVPDNYLEHQQYNDILNIAKKEKRVLITSELGGIGKTTICKKLFFDLQRENPKQIIAWTFYSGQGLLFDLKRDLLYPKEKDKSDWEERLIYYLQEEISEDAILFIDNMNTLEERERDFQLLEKARCKIICSSRTKHFENFHSIALNSFNLDDCVELFFRYSEKKDYDKSEINESIRRDVETIVKKAGYNTLIIEILAKNTAFNRIGKNNLSQLINILEEKKFNLEGEIRLKDSSGKIVNATIVDHLKRIFPVEDFSEQHRLFLYCISCLPDVTINSELGEWIIKNPTRNTIIDSLDRRGWLRWDTNGYYMHPIIKEVVQVVIDYPSDLIANFFNIFMKKTKFSQELQYEIRITYNTYLECLIDRLESQWEKFSIDEKYLMCGLIYNVSTYYFINGYLEESYYFLGKEKEKVNSVFENIERKVKSYRESKENTEMHVNRILYYRWSSLVIAIHKHLGNIFISKVKYENPTSDKNNIDISIKEFELILPYLNELMEIRNKSIFHQVYSGEIYADEEFSSRIYYQYFAVMANSYIKKLKYDPNNQEIKDKIQTYLRKAIRGLNRLINENYKETDICEKQQRYDNAANTYIYYGNYLFRQEKYYDALKKYINAKDLFVESTEKDKEMLISYAFERITEMHIFILDKTKRKNDKLRHYTEGMRNLVEAKRLRKIGIQKGNRRFDMEFLEDQEKRLEDLAYKYGLHDCV